GVQEAGPGGVQRLRRAGQHRRARGRQDSPQVSGADRSRRGLHDPVPVLSGSPQPGRQEGGGDARGDHRGRPGDRRPARRRRRHPRRPCAEALRPGVGPVNRPEAASGRRKTMMQTLTTVLLIGLLLVLPASAQPTSEKLGTVNFPTSCNSAAQAEFTRAVAMLHSFWFGHAIKGFEAAIQADASCGIAYWGGAMARMGNPLAGPPPAKDVELGAATVAKGKGIGAKSQRELDYLAAIEVFYKDYDKVDHRTRTK